MLLLLLIIPFLFIKTITSTTYCADQHVLAMYNLCSFSFPLALLASVHVVCVVVIIPSPSLRSWRSYLPLVKRLFVRAQVLLDYVLISPEGSNDRFAYVIVVDIPSSFTEDSVGEREFFLQNSSNICIIPKIVVSLQSQWHRHMFFDVLINYI